ncbi:MAG: FAD/NAD(P)-binding oxidoreductase, partial [Pseudomonadota bacterium]
QEIFEGMIATSQNRFPSLAFDVGAVNSLMSPFFPAGFYYKTFKWPAKAWDKLYEPIIRRAAGLGVSPTEQDPDRYTNRFAHCDVLVVGGGAAGLMAARTAADQGKSVILCDENPEFGGWLLSDTDVTIDGATAPEWIAGQLKALRANPNVTLLTRTTGFGYFQQNMVALAERITDHLSNPDPDLPRERMWQVRAQKVIIAQGMIERHMVFPENDRPGIVLAGAAQTWLNKYGVAVGKQIGVYTACDTAWQAAFELYEAGSDIVVIVDHRSQVEQALLDQAKELEIEVVLGSAVKRAQGKLRISGIEVVDVGSGNDTKEVREFPLDALIVSAGWTPSLHLYSQSRGKPQWDEGTQRFLPGASPQDCVSVGGCNGTDDLADVLEEAVAALGGSPKDLKVIDDVST